jgi:hypothetical protein
MWLDNEALIMIAWVLLVGREQAGPACAWAK